MAKLPDRYFVSNIEGVSLKNVLKWLNKSDAGVILQNKVSNRLLYSQVVAENEEEMEIDLAILRERLKLRHQEYLRAVSRRILIPEKLTQKYPNIVKLILAFIDAFQPIGLTTLTLESTAGGYKDLGTLIRPNLLPGAEVELTITGKKFKVLRKIVIIPSPSNKVDIEFRANRGELLGQHHLITEVAGGLIGVILDARE